MRVRPNAPSLRLGLALVCSLVVVSACGGPSAQAVPTPAGGVILSSLPHLPGSPTLAATAKPVATARATSRAVPTTAAAHTTAPKPPVASGANTILGGCPVFPSSNPWNENVSNLPVNPMSAEYIASIDSTKQFLHPDFGSNPTYGIPYTVVPASQKFVPITFNAYGDESNPGPYPIPLNAPVEAGSDHHVLVLDSGNCMLYEMYEAQQEGAGWVCASGAVFNLSSNALRPNGWTSADAAGLPILPGLALYSEVAAGVINHALRFTVDETQEGFIHPATHYASNSTNPDLPPMGLRLRLEASFSLAGFTGEALVILKALKTYGMIVADNGSSWYISGATDPRWDDNNLDELKTVPGSAFQVVETGPILHTS
jgi:hypothetical protein